MSKSVQELLDSLNAKENLIQDQIKAKMNSNEALNYSEIERYKLTEDDEKMAELFNNLINGNGPAGYDLKDFLGTPQAKVLVPKVIIGTMKRAADPIYLASKFYKKVRFNAGQAMLMPEIGVMRAHDVAEGQEIPQEYIDWQLNKSNLIKIGKSGIRIQYSDDLKNETEFDIISIMLNEAGRAMARHKEQKAFIEWLMHSHTVFDNDLRDKIAEAGTTGVDFNNNINNTLSVDDILDLLIAMYNNEFTPTNMVMHPLSWFVFAKNGLTGALTALSDKGAVLESPNKSFKVGPSSIQGRVPFDFSVDLSPFAPIDKVRKTFDIFCADQNNVGYMLVKDELKTEEFRDPSRDITNIKAIERYGYATLNEGRAICSARNVSMARSYPTPERTIVLNQN